MPGSYSADPVRRPDLYGDEGEWLKHLHTIHSLADQLHADVSDVAGRYEAELEKIRPSAIIPDYLPVLVSKRLIRQFRELIHH